MTTPEVEKRAEAYCTYKNLTINFDMIHHCRTYKNNNATSVVHPQRKQRKISTEGREERKEFGGNRSVGNSEFFASFAIFCENRLSKGRLRFFAHEKRVPDKQSPI